MTKKMSFIQVSKFSNETCYVFHSKGSMPMWASFATFPDPPWNRRFWEVVVHKSIACIK